MSHGPYLYIRLFEKNDLVPLTLDQVRRSMYLKNELMSVQHQQLESYVSDRPDRQLLLREFAGGSNLLFPCERIVQLVIDSNHPAYDIYNWVTNRLESIFKPVVMPTTNSDKITNALVSFLSIQCVEPVVKTDPSKSPKLKPTSVIPPERAYQHLKKWLNRYVQHKTKEEPEHEFPIVAPYIEWIQTHVMSLDEVHRIKLLDASMRWVIPSLMDVMCFYFNRHMIDSEYNEGAKSALWVAEADAVIAKMVGDGYTKGKELREKYAATENS